MQLHLEFSNLINLTICLLNSNKITTLSGTLNTNSDYDNLENGIFAFNTWAGQNKGNGIPDTDVGVIIQIPLDDKIYQICLGAHIQFRYVNEKWNKCQITVIFLCM